MLSDTALYDLQRTLTNSVSDLCAALDKASAPVSASHKGIVEHALANCCVPARDSQGRIVPNGYVANHIVNIFCLDGTDTNTTVGIGHEILLTDSTLCILDTDFGTINEIALDKIVRIRYAFTSETGHLW